MTPPVTSKTYLGIFFLTLATILYEIVLTRVFSVTMWYHFAFMAISLALFGMAMGAVVVFVWPKFFTRERAHRIMGASSLLFTITSITMLLLHLRIPFIPEFSLKGFATVLVTYSMIAVPFVFSGVAVCVALTKYPDYVSRLYAVDLVGAGLGCLLLIAFFSFADAPTVVMLTAILGGFAAVMFSWQAGQRWVIYTSIPVILLLTGFSVLGTVRAQQNKPLVPFTWFKEAPNLKGQEPLYQVWNHYSYLRVTGDLEGKEKPIGWGLSKTYPPERTVRQVWVTIDGHAGTGMTHWTGENQENVEHLKFDLSNLVHYIRDDAHALVIGVGGGRDILSALLFDQKKVTGVEINKDIIGMLTGRFADYTGNLEDDPRVDLVVDEARSYIARSEDDFDIIQVSLIDTWAATAAGAFALTENALYTKDAWNTMLEHLSDDGVLTYTRWFYIPAPYESWRLVSLATAALRDQGVENPKDHILMARAPFNWNIHQNTEYDDFCVATILVSKTPFSDEDIENFNAVCERLEFPIVIQPGSPSEFEEFDQIMAAEDLNALAKTFPVNIAPPTDNTPFFFQMIRPKDFLNRDILHTEGDAGALAFNNKAITTLVVLMIAVLILTAVFIIGPLFLVKERPNFVTGTPYFLYFSGIGLGFMLVEISQMQRLNIYLGHPTYSLVATLFAILISSGIGSYLTISVTEERLPKSGLRRLGGLIILLTAFGLLTPMLLDYFNAAPMSIRLILSMMIFVPMGLFMGMAFPLGIKLAAAGRQHLLTPWLWAVNGATSVCASVLTVLLSLLFGISFAFWVGVACYVVTFLAFIYQSRRNEALPKQRETDTLAVEDQTV